MATVEEAVQMARQHYQCEHFHYVEILCRQILGVVPGQLEALELLGFALLRLGRQEQAVPWLKQAVEHDPGNALFHFLLGAAQLGVAASGEALLHFQEALRLQPEMTEARFQLGNTFAARGQWASAACHYEQVIAKVPDHVEGLGELGKVLTELGHFERALTALRRGLSLKRDAGDLHLYLGNTLARSGQLPEAEAHWEQALYNGVSTARAFEELREAFRSLGKVARVAQSDKGARVKAAVDRAYAIGMQQIREEIEALAAFVFDLNPSHLMEIGSHQGGTFTIWCEMARNPGRCISLDLPGGDFGGLAAAPFTFSGMLTHAAFSLDGNKLLWAVGGSGFEAVQRSELRIWDIALGREAGPPLVHPERITYAAFSPNGACVVTASADQTARVWDVASGQPLTPPLRHHGTVSHAAFSADGRLLVTASHDRTARVWVAESGEPVTAPLRHRAEVVYAAFSAAGSQIVTATARLTPASEGVPLGAVQVWNLAPEDQSPEQLRLLAETLTGHRLDETGGAVPLEPAALAERWKRLRPPPAHR